MRIQHNISAMNSYRNFSANNSKLTKNLEKLSTGYKINRAGDDAAGLAISEKMRAQISGIEGATKNAKDGISLIQTAEGALTEVHDMLNRMTTLAEQSANGTYDNDVDRAQLQKEVDSLKSEIDRIADSTNYNGLKLLDGSLSGASNIKGAVTVESIEATYAKAATAKLTAISSMWGAASTVAAENDKISYTVSWKDGDGNDKATTVEFKFGSKNGATDGNSALIAADGTKYELVAPGKTAVGTDAAGKDLLNAVVSELNKNADFSANFKASVSAATDITAGDSESGAASAAGGVLFTSKGEGTKGSVVQSVQVKTHQYDSDNDSYTTRDVDSAGGGTILARLSGTDAGQELKLDNIRVLKNADVTDTTINIEDHVFEVEGKKFALYAGDEQNTINKMKDALGSDVTVIQLGTNATNKAGGATYTADAGDAATIAGELSRVTGSKFGVNGTKVVTAGDTKLQTAQGKSLDLQIGDTAASYNKMSVSIKDMHTESIGIGDVDISTQEGAAAALDQIKAAVNNVSDVRGSMGALQNRLDHTINNLGVMRENIQNAESLIRDTDVAEEMMTYTKNNILNQSAQAMLAQANQLPQGVLQLLG